MDEEENKVKYQEELVKAITPMGNDKMTFDEWVRFAMEKLFKRLV